LFGREDISHCRSPAEASRAGAQVSKPPMLSVWMLGIPTDA